MLNNNHKIKPLALVVAMAFSASSAHAVDFNFGEDDDILLPINLGSASPSRQLEPISN